MGFESMSKLSTVCFLNERASPFDFTSNGTPGTDNVNFFKSASRRTVTAQNMKSVESDVETLNESRRHKDSPQTNGPIERK